MGTDIHMYIQYRKKNELNGIWSGFGHNINPGRNYDMFGLLGGVRGMSKNNTPSKGIPSFGISYECESDLYGPYKESEGKKLIMNDIHNISWLTTIELKKIYKKYKKEYGKIPIQYKNVLKVMKTLENKGKDEVVIIFWFDS